MKRRAFTGGVSAGLLSACCLWQAAELLKDKAAWLRGCRRCEVLGGFTAAGAGRVDLLYTQVGQHPALQARPPAGHCTRDFLHTRSCIEYEQPACLSVTLKPYRSAGYSQ